MTMLKFRAMESRLASREARGRLRFADYVNFPSDGQRHELIDGEHYVTPTPLLRHQRVAGRLHVAFSIYFRETPIGESLMAPLAVILSDHDVVEPDVLVVVRDQHEILSDTWVFGAPAIAVEVVSPSSRRRDEQLKRQLYDRVGVREYWMVYPDRQVIRVARRTAHGVLQIQPENAAAANDTLTSPLLPGFTLELSDLFRQPL